MSEPPFTRIATKVLVENPWHRYCVDRYVRTDGSEGEYFYVDMPGAVGIIPRFDDGTTLLCRQWRYLLGRHLWEFPIGGMKRGEDPRHAAEHELEEEAGLIASRWTYLGAFAPYKGVSTEHTYYFLAEGLTQVAQRLEPEEDITLHRMSLDDARARLLDQELCDAQSWGGLMLLDRHFARGGR
ncbi:MAG: NUDIX hydrolase [Planctomycetes bacterium]|nr:NUDIX hydrolase [Planctomycetota bacterium]MCC7169745.1 NUDIX hydrolase [Planctomycetota bacterium]